MKNDVSLRCVLLAVTLAALPTSAQDQGGVTIGRKNFREQAILCEILRQHLGSQLNVQVRCDKPSDDPDAEIRRGKIDLYVEYTGTAYSEILKLPATNLPLRGATMTAVISREYARKGLLWLDSLGFDDPFVMVVRQQDAVHLDIRRLSDLKRAGVAWRIGSGPDFQIRTDGLGGLLKQYEFKMRGRPITADIDVLFPLLQARAVDMIAANKTDPLINDSFFVLDDDRHYFPEYRAAVVLRNTTALRYPSIKQALGELKDKISDYEMGQLLQQVSGRGDAAAEAAARDFLRRIGDQGQVPLNSRAAAAAR